MQRACLHLIHERKQEEYKTSCWLTATFPVAVLSVTDCPAVVVAHAV